MSARPDESFPANDAKSKPSDGTDVDLQRAKDLLDLHATIKLAHKDGTDKDLDEARESVEKVLRSL